ncbi:DUF6513 domain-containing protein [Pyrolobus fumarii]|uniref:DUF6513 domain-containing protein n=1 Tax=Pyrolobus fumarii TaxID=54252 RepID=UPI001FCAF173|nr:DUF6513 domain-containing protein [Pyrolobus fumarii]
MLVTGRLASGAVKRVAEKLRAMGFDVFVEVADVDVASLVPPLFVESVARRYGRGTLVILPPYARVDFEKLWRETGVVVVRGPVDPRLLPEVLPRVDLSALRPGDRLDAVTSVGPRVDWNAEPYAVLRCGLAFYRRPPPVVLLREVMADSIAGYQPMGEAHGVVVGFTRGVTRAEAHTILENASGRFTCWGVDADNDDVILDAVDLGASVVLSVYPGREELLHSLPRGVAVVLIPSGIGEPLPPPRERVERLSRLALDVLDAGLVPVLDPLLAPPCMGLLDSLMAYREASSLGYPLLAGLGNVYELLDADTTGVLALLSVLLVEAGVSVFLVTGESWKARHAPLEAPIAALMASVACHEKRPPKDLGVDLLVAREKRPAPLDPPGWRPGITRDAESVERIPFQRDPAGDNLVEAHPDGRIRVLHKWSDGRVEALEGRDPYALYRAAISLGYVTRLDHAAWLGFEIGVAYALLRLGRTYSTLGGVPRGVTPEDARRALGVLSVNPASHQRGPRGGARPPRTP